jgi:glutamine synthetase
VTDPHVDDSWERLPADIEGAIANSDPPLPRAVFGDVFVENFLVMQHREAEAFRAQADQGDEVSEWEIARYRAVI